MNITKPLEETFATIQELEFHTLGGSIEENKTKFCGYVGGF